MLNFFHNSYIFILIEKLINFINSVFFVLLLIALSFALIFSPPDYLQGDSVRIMYVHVPAAWISLASFTCIAIVTGSIWGQPTWGTFWAWDARITSMVVMALFYCLFIVIHKFFNEDDKANKISSVIAIIGLINIPIIKYSVDWWSTLHQPASIKITGTSTIHSSMLMPLLLMFFVLILYCALIFLMKYKTEIIRIKKKNLKRYD